MVFTPSSSELERWYRGLTFLLCGLTWACGGDTVVAVTVILRVKDRALAATHAVLPLVAVTSSSRTLGPVTIKRERTAAAVSRSLAPLCSFLAPLQYFLWLVS